MTRELARRPRDVAITDFHFTLHAQSVLAGRRGHSYLVYAVTRAENLRISNDHVSELTRQVVGCVLTVLVGGFIATMIWFGFLAPLGRQPSVTMTATDSTMTGFLQREGLSTETLAR